MRASLFLSFFIGTLLATSPVQAAEFKAPSKNLADAKAGRYVLDDKHASLTFTINHLGYSHYTGRINNFEADVTLNAEDVTKSSVKATIYPASVDTNNSQLEAKLTDTSFFNTAAFPRASFASTNIVKTGDNTANITGDLTFLGITKPIVLAAIFNGSGINAYAKKAWMGVSAKGSFKRSDFGMTAYIPDVADEVTIALELEFRHVKKRAVTTEKMEKTEKPAVKAATQPTKKAADAQ